MVKKHIAIALALLFHTLVASNAFAVPGRNGDDDGTDQYQDLSDLDTKGATFDQLLDDAQELILSKRPIDARAKLQKAVQLNPLDYRPHMLLGQYYLFDVGHFTLAYRYIRTAEDLFVKQFGIADGRVDPAQSRQHATLLYLRSEAELNLDKYEDSLKTLDRFGSLYWTDWYPGTRAWVLMKLKRVDEAINVAQSALIDPSGQTDRRRTYNILGILLSVKGNRELSLKAFQQAIASEISLGSLGQVATPLNNAGEVYRELFRDNLAEASWLRATRLPDGCDHILPSLNLAILYIDETRFLQAERALSDFEACYAQQGERADTEHRALLALARGRIALREGDVDEAIKSLTMAGDRQQWFGKIGTNENDVRFAQTITMAQALEAKAAALEDTVRDSISETALDVAQIPVLKLRAWWLYRQARLQGIEELSDLEDLFIRNTDTMIEYPTLGDLLRGFPSRSLRKRVERMKQEDDRQKAVSYYKLYLAENLLAHGDEAEALTLFHEVLGELRPIDSLVRARVLADILVAEGRTKHFWTSVSRDEQIENMKMREDLFTLLPSQLRYSALKLPVTTLLADDSDLRSIRSSLSPRFEEAAGDLQTVPKFQLQLTTEERAEGKQVLIRLVNKNTSGLIASFGAILKPDGSGRADLINNFINSAFHHKLDPAGEPVPKLDLLNGLM